MTHIGHETRSKDLYASTVFDGFKKSRGPSANNRRSATISLAAARGGVYWRGDRGQLACQKTYTGQGTRGAPDSMKCAWSAREARATSASGTIHVMRNDEVEIPLHGISARRSTDNPARTFA